MFWSIETNRSIRSIGVPQQSGDSATYRLMLHYNIAATLNLFIAHERQLTVSYFASSFELEFRDQKGKSENADYVLFLKAITF